MKFVISIVYAMTVNCGRTIKITAVRRRGEPLKNVIHDFQGLVGSHFGKYELSGFCTDEYYEMCHLGDDIGQNGDTNILYVGLHENWQIVFKKEYRRAFLHLSSCIEEDVR